MLTATTLNKLVSKNTQSAVAGENFELFDHSFELAVVCDPGLDCMQKQRRSHPADSYIYHSIAADGAIRINIIIYHLSLLRPPIAQKPPNLDIYTSEVTNVYVTSNQESVPVTLRKAFKDTLVSTGMTQQQLETFFTICREFRCEYEKTGAFLSSPRPLPNTWKFGSVRARWPVWCTLSEHYGRRLEAVGPGWDTMKKDVPNHSTISR